MKVPINYNYSFSFIEELAKELNIPRDELLTHIKNVNDRLKHDS